MHTAILQYCTSEYHKEQETGTEDILDECVPGAHILGTWSRLYEILTRRWHAFVQAKDLSPSQILCQVWQTAWAVDHVW